MASQEVSGDEETCFYAQCGVRDEDIPGFLARQVLHHGLTHLDFSRNSLTSAGVECLLQACSLQSLRVVKFYRNSLSDAASASMALLCLQCPSLAELHLSHNSFTERGARAIVDAASTGEKHQGIPPLWLRLEHNRVESPAELLAAWALQGLPVCGVAARCRRVHCCWNRRVHLPHFTSQAASDTRYSASSDHSVHVERADVAMKSQERIVQSDDCEQWHDEWRAWKEARLITKKSLRLFVYMSCISEQLSADVVRRIAIGCDGERLLAIKNKHPECRIKLRFRGRGLAAFEVCGVASAESSAAAFAAALAAARAAEQDLRLHVHNLRGELHQELQVQAVQSDGEETFNAQACRSDFAFEQERWRPAKSVATECQHCEGGVTRDMDDGLKHRVLDIAAAWELECTHSEATGCVLEVAADDKQDRVSTEKMNVDTSCPQRSVCRSLAADAGHVADQLKCPGDVQEDSEHVDSANKSLAWHRLDDTTRLHIMDMVEEPEIDFDSEESEWDEPLGRLESRDSDSESSKQITLEDESGEPQQGVKQDAKVIADHAVVTDSMRAQEPRVIYSGPGFFVLFKPPRVVCDPPNSNIGVAQYVRELGIEDTDSAICHRLDYPTSGLLLVGSEQDVTLDLLRQRNSRSWRKEYVCLMHGWLPPDLVHGTIDFKLRTEREGRGFRTSVDEEWGSAAITHYAAIRHYKCRSSGRPFTLLLLRIETGRTHQIRVHLCQLARCAGISDRGIVGDAKYLDTTSFAFDFALFRRASVAMRQVIEPRLCLHACSLGFIAPGSKSCTTVNCGLPYDMAALISHELVEEPSRSPSNSVLARNGTWILQELETWRRVTRVGDEASILLPVPLRSILRCYWEAWVCLRRENTTCTMTSTEHENTHLEAAVTIQNWGAFVLHLLDKDLSAQQRKMEALCLSELAGIWQDSFGPVARVHGEMMEMCQDGEVAVIEVLAVPDKSQGRCCTISVLLYGDSWQADLLEEGRILRWASGEMWQSSKSDRSNVQDECLQVGSSCFVYGSDSQRDDCDEIDSRSCDVTDEETSFQDLLPRPRKVIEEERKPRAWLCRSAKPAKATVLATRQHVVRTWTTRKALPAAPARAPTSDPRGQEHRPAPQQALDQLKVRGKSPGATGKGGEMHRWPGLSSKQPKISVM
eukprot:TRINITY_DN5410_c0_g1_i2.p1 TRINITY_DN5410_c0_g1~~TRINITY_DN5410_c0_g1_i2.p1  ORF type:complete len:1155 (-),score=195.62 TRINITY_DN5410_c0_g1_i2:19-3483(-)